MQLTEIHIYPVKSCAGISLLESEITASGLRFDRQWMIIDQNKRCLTQRTHPQMALLETALVDDQLVLSSFGLEDHIVPKVDSGMEKVQTAVFGAPVTGIDIGGATSEWLSQSLDSSCTLLCFSGDEIRPCDPALSKPGDHTMFADAFPLLVLSQSSLDDLNCRLASPVSMDRFRPNLVVSGCNAFDEDHWKHIQINAITIRFAQTCARCSVPTVDQQTGMLAGPEPIHTLSTYRRRDGEIYFGINMVPEVAGTLHVGDGVTTL